MHAPLIAALLLLSPPLAPQSIHQVLTPPSPPPTTGEGIGVDVCGLPDINGDSVADFAVAFVRSTASDPNVRVYSGLDHRVLLAIDVGPVSGQGMRIENAGDIDSDGISDLIVGLPQNPSLDDPDGLVYVYSLRTSSLLRVHVGSIDSELGSSVAGLGDMDGDGVDDYGAGAPGDGPHNHGRVFVWSGATGLLIHEQPGLHSARRLGVSLDRVGDANGDGWPDVVAGGYRDSDYIGTVVVFTPILGSVIHSQTGPDGYGAAVAGVRDASGDGRDDFAVGSPYATNFVGTNKPHAGAVRVVSGVTGFGLWSLLGTTAGDRIGLDLAAFPRSGDGDDLLVGANGFLELRRSDNGAILDSLSVGSGGVMAPPYTEREVRVSTMSDADGGGSDEIIAGAPTSNPAGSVHPFSSTGVVQVFAGETGFPRAVLLPRTGQESGASVAILGDVNGDSIADTAIGTPHDDTEKFDGGSVRVVSGSNGDEIWRIDGEGTSVQCGAALCVLEDLDADGIPDLAIGEPRTVTGGIFDARRTGTVRVVSGASGAEIHVAEGDEAGERFGAAIAAVGDLDGDGVSDYAVGAPDYWAQFGILNFRRAGRVSVRSGASGLEIKEFTHHFYEARLGWSVAGLGDVDGDGTPDIAAGSPHANRTTLFSGSDGSILWNLVGTSSSAAGTALSAIPDVDGDGIKDLAIGEPEDPADPSAGAGLVRIVSGATSVSLRSHLGSQAGEQFGISLASLGDVDANGQPDLAMGAPGYTTFTPFPNLSVGRVVVRNALASSAIREWTGTASSGELGRSLGAYSGADYNGDGIADIAAGLPGASSDLGSTYALSTRAWRTTPYGSGTDGCDGRELLIASVEPELGAAFALRATSSQPNGVVFLAVSLAPDLAGTDFGTGCLFHWSLPQQVVLPNTLANPDGVATFPFVLPSAPAFQGLHLYAQALAFWASPCGAVPLGLSGTHGLDLALP